MHVYLTETRINLILLYLSVFLTLWIGYIKFIIPVYEYSGFKWAPNEVKIVESLLAIVLLASSLPSRVKRPSDFFIHVHFMMPVLPMLVLYSASDLPRSYIYFVLSAFVVVCSVRRCKLPMIKGGFVSIRAMMWGLLFVAAICIFSIILQGGLSYFNINLLRVYEFRNEASQALPRIFGYFTPMTSKVILPSVLVLAVYDRKWLVAGLALIGSVMMFGLTGHKGPLFYPFLALGVYFVMRTRRMVQLSLVCYIAVIFVSLAFYYMIDSNIIVGSMSLRRVYFVPARLNFLYYDFFSSHPYTMLAESKLTFGLIPYPYDLTATHVIGYHYFDNELTGANTGWLGSGYMHFGFAGMLIYALMIGLLLSVLDRLAKKKELAVVGAIMVVPVLTSFQSSDLPTCVLTHGLLLCLFLIWSCKLDTQVRSEPPKSTIARFFRLMVGSSKYAHG